MKVKAKFTDQTKFGFYGHKRRYNGDVFEIESEKHFSEKWMEKVSKPGRPKKDEGGE